MCDAVFIDVLTVFMIFENGSTEINMHPEINMHSE
jgi:hypothetical protein